mgnify:CR=1 FL=1
MIPKRWEEVRPPSKNELKATEVLEISLDEASAKIRTGGPVDEKEDYELNIWAGVLPFKNMIMEPVPDDHLKSGVDAPQSVMEFMKAKG